MSEQPHTLPLRALAAAEAERQKSMATDIKYLKYALGKTLGEQQVTATFADDGTYPTATIDGLTFRRSAHGDYLRLRGICSYCGLSAWSPSITCLETLGHELERFSTDCDHVCQSEHGSLGARLIALLDEWHDQRCEDGS